MKKTMIVTVPMRNHVNPMTYTDNGKEDKVVYPIIKCLDGMLSAGDDLDVILIVKKYGEYQKNTERFYFELNERINGKNITCNILQIDSDFDESFDVHETLFLEVVKKIPSKSHIYADITYGPKDVPIIIFTALDFAQKFLGCTVEKIVYGMGKFTDNNELFEAKLCNLSSLFQMHNFFSVVEIENPEDAIKTLELIVKQ